MALHPAEIEWLELRYPGDQPFPVRIRSGRRRIQRIRALCGLGLGFIVLTIGGAIDSAQLQSRLAGRPTWLYVLGTVLLAAGFATMAVGLWHGARAGRLEAKRDSPLWALDGAERRAIYARLRGRTVPDEGDILFLRSVALSLAQQRYVVLVCGGLSLCALGPLLAEQMSAARMILTALAVVGLAVVALTSWRKTRIGREFAARYPVVDGDAAAADTTAYGQ